ncbi:MAG: DnaJ domain-containing protein [Actinobacteria bacterium]|nr:DnaJ domain-containing protein [Actinomycetota bacterium]
MNHREWLSRDFYAVLDIDLSATDQQIKSAYRSMARKHHPDANAGDPRSEERFKQIQQAYSVLSDRSQRDLYDRIRRGGSPMMLLRPSGFAKYRVNLAGMRTPPRRPTRGNDLEVEVVLTHREARKGRLVRLQCRDAGKPTRTAIVFLHPGVDDGTRLHLKGKGGFGANGGGFGDLYINVKVLPATWFGLRDSHDPGPRSWEDGMAPASVRSIARASLKALFRPEDVKPT